MSDKVYTIEEIKEILLPIIPIEDIDKIYLFGSYAKGTQTNRSDIDICIVANTSNKRSFLKNLYLQADLDIMVDFLLYTPDEWEENIKDTSSFANKILNLGVILYG